MARSRLFGPCTTRFLHSPAYSIYACRLETGTGTGTGIHVGLSPGAGAVGIGCIFRFPQSGRVRTGCHYYAHCHFRHIRGRQQTVDLVGKNRVCHDHSVRRILRTIVRKRLRRRRRHVVPDSVFFDRIGRRRGIAGAGCTGHIVASSVFRMQPARYCDGHLIRSGRHNDTVPCKNVPVYDKITPVK